MGFLPAGHRVGPWTIIAPLGEGGMGSVYLAESRGRRAAVKLLSALSDLESVQRFERELAVLARLPAHPSSARVYGCDLDATPPWIAMEVIDGTPLDRRLKQGPLAVEQARAIALDVFAGLENAHSIGVVHRDIKAANVILRAPRSSSEEHAEAVLIDFGLARASGLETLTRTGQAFGTPYCMAPEQVEGKPTGPATDIWACGVLLYEMVTGVRPFRGVGLGLMSAILSEEPTPVATLRPEAAGLDPLIAAMLAKRPEDRPSTADAIEILEGRAAAPRQSRRALIVGLLALLVLLTGSLMFLVGSDPAPIAPRVRAALDRYGDLLETDGIAIARRSSLGERFFKPGDPLSAPGLGGLSPEELRSEPETPRRRTLRFRALLRARLLDQPPHAGIPPFQPGETEARLLAAVDERLAGRPPTLLPENVGPYKPFAQLLKALHVLERGRPMKVSPSRIFGLSSTRPSELRAWDELCHKIDRLFEGADGDRGIDVKGLPDSPVFETLLTRRLESSPEEAREIIKDVGAPRPGAVSRWLQKSIPTVWIACGEIRLRELIELARSRPDDPNAFPMKWIAAARCALDLAAIGADVRELAKEIPSSLWENRIKAELGQTPGFEDPPEKRIVRDRNSRDPGKRVELRARVELALLRLGVFIDIQLKMTSEEGARQTITRLAGATPNAGLPIHERFVIARLRMNEHPSKSLPGDAALQRELLDIVTATELPMLARHWLLSDSLVNIHRFPGQLPGPEGALTEIFAHKGWPALRQELESLTGRESRERRTLIDWIEFLADADCRDPHALTVAESCRRAHEWVLENLETIRDREKPNIRLQRTRICRAWFLCLQDRVDEARTLLPALRKLKPTDFMIRWRLIRIARALDDTSLVTDLEPVGLPRYTGASEHRERIEAWLGRPLTLAEPK